MADDGWDRTEVKIKAREAWDLTMALVAQGMKFEVARYGAAISLALSEKDRGTHEHEVGLPDHASGETPRDGGTWEVTVFFRPRRGTLRPDVTRTRRP